MAKDDKTQVLAGIPLFRSCSKKELSLLASLCTEATLPSGHVLTEQGTYGKEFFVLVQGTAEAVRDGVLLEELKAGSPVGELSLLDGAPRAATVTATSDLHVLVLSIGEFSSALAQSPALSKALLTAVTSRLRTVLGVLEATAL